MMPVKACGCGWDCWMEMKLQSLCHVRVLLCEQLLNFENWQPSASANRLRLHPLQKAAKQCHWVEDDHSKPSPQETRAFPERVAEITACHYVNFSTIC